MRLGSEPAAWSRPARLHHWNRPPAVGSDPHAAVRQRQKGFFVRRKPVRQPVADVRPLFPFEAPAFRGLVVSVQPGVKVSVQALARDGQVRSHPAGDARDASGPVHVLEFVVVGRPVPDAGRRHRKHHDPSPRSGAVAAGIAGTLSPRDPGTQRYLVAVPRPTQLHSPTAGPRIRQALRPPARWTTCAGRPRRICGGCSSVRPR